MLELSITTPAVLFPAISLLLLAYTNRYIAISNRIRILHDAYRKEKNTIVLSQIYILRRRIHLIKNMQLFGVFSIFFAAFTMFLVFESIRTWATWVFLMSIICLLVSLALSIYEVLLSNKALSILLKDIEEEINKQETEFL
ncbi:MAG: DUF2721 domain-containing protein [Cytophagales bacterium]